MTHMPESASPHRRHRRCPHAQVLATVLLIAGCATTAPQVDESVDLGFPSPLSGPGRPTLEEDSRDAVFAAWALLTAGQTDQARLRASTALPAPPAALVIQQAAILEGRPQPDELVRITDQAPAYAAAWATLSVAAERAGDEALALDSAHRVAALWTTPPWSDRARDLERRWIDDRVEQAARAVADDDSDTAMTLLEKALTLRPEHREGLLILGGAEQARGDLDAADAALARLGDDPEALLERAEIARRQGRPSAAMDLLARLPDDHPDRGAALRRARLEWRLTVMPPRVQEALASPSVTRAELAILMVSLAPDLDRRGGAPPPLMTDVVDHPAQREILTAVRLGLLAPDAVDGRFHPDLPAPVQQIRDAVTVTCRLVGYREPLWCSDSTGVESGCHQLVSPVPGLELKRIVLEQAGATP
jgi:tetratricopeptide (TPR) repeat protein